MRYTLPKHLDSRTIAYRGTIETLDDPDLQNLKKSVAATNKYYRETSRSLGRKIGTLSRVCVKGRGPRHESYYHTNLHEATHFDVYVQDDNSSMALLKEELETGMTPGEIAKRNKLKTEIWKLEMRGLRRIK